MFMEKRIKKIIRQVGDIGEKVSRLLAEESLPSIELDILLGDVRSLYEEIKDLPSGTNIPAGKETAETKKMETESKKVKTVTENSEDEPAILADRYKGEKKFINERLAENGKKRDISSKIKSKPIRNIGSALGINDRFKLINDLFNGDKDSYQNTIGMLDGASNFNEAFNYITSSFDWDMEEESVQILLDLVRRKFIVNQNE